MDPSTAAALVVLGAGLFIVVAWLILRSRKAAQRTARPAPASIGAPTAPNAPQAGAPEVEAQAKPWAPRSATAVEDEVVKAPTPTPFQDTDDDDLVFDGGEDELWRRIARAFYGETLARQATPPWLFPQHLDIYFPGRGLGIEFQGAQHAHPVEAFGGAEGLLVQRQRDVKKWEICRRNGVRILYVLPVYKFSEVAAEVTLLLQDAKRPASKQIGEFRYSRARSF